ncbi:MAG: hypothetical protein CL840_12130 [Crocinitomicaceae bacterium]|nr:hypothetical protein [Crocinitomicaceae bacterium]|tara:strand:+ start:4455 stop:4997 length:543 start_codon:yes stop_codon:yes gene_type:complete
MFTFLTKKKITEKKLANLFVSGILHLVDQGFPDVAGMINEDPEFEKRPNISNSSADRFLMIVIAGNLQYIPKYFNDYQDVRLIDAITSDLASALNLDYQQLKAHISKYQSKMNRLNMPSKNIHYGMSKAVFHKYNLNDYQEQYFRNMNSPNPIFLKRLDDIMENFIWDWQEIQQKYRIIE